MPKSKLYIETWTSDLGGAELQHFLNNKYGDYVFGINKKLLGKKVYNQILKIIKKKLKI